MAAREIMRYVIALGGNALEKATMHSVAKAIRTLCRKGDEIVMTHGNGPQVGELATLEKKSLALLTAQTAAEIGLAIEGSLHTKESKVATLITRVLVNPQDSAFRNPSKPIGKVLGRSEAMEHVKMGFVVRKTAVGLRRVVASPAPQDILETRVIRSLLGGGYMVIAGGGGGVPMFYKGGRVCYADAVIDKDLTSALIAEKVGADRLVILTTVDGAYTGFKTKKQRRIGKIRADALEAMLALGEFEDGSMKPKVRACINFVKATGGIASIGSLSRPTDALSLKNATVITS